MPDDHCRREGFDLSLIVRRHRTSESGELARKSRTNCLGIEGIDGGVQLVLALIEKEDTQLYWYANTLYSPSRLTWVEPVLVVPIV